MFVLDEDVNNTRKEEIEISTPMKEDIILVSTNSACNSAASNRVLSPTSTLATL